MRFTVAALHKRLGKLIEQGHARLPVCVNKNSFRDNREADGCVILELAGLGVDLIRMCDDDGGTKCDSRGREVSRWTLVLAGSSGANMKGELVKDD